MSASEKPARSKSTDSSASNKSLKKLGKYLIQRKLGAGGMGAVFLAKDTKTNRSVALKVLPKDKAANKVLVKRFQSEASSAALLEHDNIVRVYDADEADGYLYIALEFVDGTDVDQLLRKRERIPVKRAGEIIKQVASALQHAHEQNVVHRDIKPSNIMIRKDGVVKLTDLGLARSVDESLDTSITREGTTVGTVDYMAPEQARNSRYADIRSDLYSLGCTWYQMLTGHAPFHEGSVTNKLQAHAISKPPNPRDENPEIPEAVVAIIHRLMEKKPEDRYQTPQELLDDLDNAHLHRETVSNNVFAALARSTEEETKEELTATEYGDDSGLPPRTGSNASKNRPLPPKEKAQKKQHDEEEQEERNLAPIKYVIVAGLIIAAVSGIFYIVQMMASGLDSGGAQQYGESSRHVADDLLNENNSPAVRRTPKLQENSEEKDQSVAVQIVDPNRRKTDSSATVRSAVEFVPPELQAQIPKWAGSYPMPDEVDQLTAHWNPEVRTVGRWQNRVGDYESLDAALDNLSGHTVHVKLIGPGPFVLSPHEIEGKRLIVSGDAGLPPVVTLLAGETPPGASFLRLKESSLIMAGVHLLVAVHQLAASGDVNVIHLSGGNLALRSCSISLLGSRTGSTSAIHLSGNGERNGVPEVVLDRMLIRGNLKSLSLNRAAFDSVISNSLFISGDAPCVDLTGSMSGLETTTELNPNSRKLRLMKSTLISDSSLIKVDAGENLVKPAPVSIDVFASVLGTTHEHQQPLLDLTGWPILSTEVGTHPAVNFRWEQDQTILIGWKKLAMGGQQSKTQITDKTAWESFWNLPANSVDYEQEFWKSSQPITEAYFLLSDWSSDKIPGKVSVEAKSNTGCDLKELILPSSDHHAMAVAFSRLETIGVPTLDRGKAIKTIELDLNKLDLGKRLAQDDWSDGTRFLLTGKGSRATSAIEVNGKSFTLEFAENADSTFQIEPKRGLGGEAMIAVTNGSLQLKNVRLNFPNRSGLPQWMVRVSDGSLLCSGSELTGPSGKQADHAGTIRWENLSAESRSTPPQAIHRHAFSLVDSFLTTSATGLSLAPGEGLVQWQNSIIATEGPNCRIQLTAPAQATFNLVSSTLTSSESIFEFADEPNDQATPQAYFLVRQNLFAPPLDAARNQKPFTIMSGQAAWGDPKQILWWENSNGYSSLIKSYFRNISATAAPQDFANDWRNRWGADFVRRPLIAPDGVILKGEYPDRGTLDPDHFILDARAKANSWRAGNQPLGANLAQAAATANKQDAAGKKPPAVRNPRLGGF